MDVKNPKIIKWQDGFQEKFLSCPADIVIGGGSAGGGKTFALLLDPLRFKDVKGFEAVIFRRITPQIRNPGGLWDTSQDLYALIGGDPKETTLEWRFPKSNFKFSHLEHEKNKHDWQGSQIAYIGFDEVTQFSESQFFYLLTRNRSTCGIRPCVRATCNPDPDSWLAKFIAWWIDQETGFPIPERDGVIRYFTRDSGEIVWGDTKAEVLEKCPHIFNNPAFDQAKKEDLIKSMTFIRGDVYENKILLEKDPQYLANLISQDDETKAQLLDGNWKIRQDGMALCDYQKIEELFSNFVRQYKKKDDGEFLLDANGNKISIPQKKCITCDAARFGRDLAVVKTWEGFEVTKIAIFTKSKTTDLTEYIESERQRCSIAKSDVLVDQDGVGGGVVDEGGYVGFSGGAPTFPDPKTKIKENYANLKTQCWYRMADRINRSEVAITSDNYYVNGDKTDIILIGKQVYKIQALIKQDLRSFKRENPDSEGKKQMNNKESQKNILNGRSPDFGDSIMMREFFELKNRPILTPFFV